MAKRLATEHAERGNAARKKAEAMMALKPRSIIKASQHLNNAREFYDKALEIEPNHEGALRGKAQAAIHLKDYSTAADCYEKILENNLEDDEARLDLGKALYNIGQFDDAALHLKKVVKADPKNEDALFFLGRSLQGLKRHDEAAEQFEKILRINPDDSRTLVWLAETYYRRKDYATAIHRSNMALKRLPEAPIGQDLSHEGALRNKAKSIRLWSKIWRLSPFDGSEE